MSTKGKSPSPAKDPSPIAGSPRGAPAEQNEQIEATQPEDVDDDDSAYAPSLVGTDTTSIKSSIMEYRKENGRTYHSYGTKEYYGANDEAAQDQMDISHQWWTLVLDGKLITAPIENPRNVLDLGTGTGIWAIDFADAHPEAKVKGTDLSPIQPAFVPPNCEFIIDDYNLPFTEANTYDLIHERELLGTVADYPAFYKGIFDALVPGGWLDCQSVDVRGYYSQKLGDVMLPSDHVAQASMEFAVKAAESTGMVFKIVDLVEGWLKDAGFINISIDLKKVPLGTWPKDKKQKELGAWNLLRLTIGMFGFYVRLYTKILGWSVDEVRIYTAKVNAAMKDPTLQLFQIIPIISAQKPLE